MGRVFLNFVVFQTACREKPPFFRTPLSAPTTRNGKNGFLFGYNETAESAQDSEPERLLLVFRYEVRPAQPDEAEGVFALRRDASGQRLRGTQ